MGLRNFIVYLLHFGAPVGNPENKHGQAQHYLGSTDNLDRRLDEHLSGKGSPLVKAAVDQGIPVKVARTWRGHRADRLLERQLKSQHHNERLCPDCNPDGWDRRGNA